MSGLDNLGHPDWFGFAEVAVFCIFGVGRSWWQPWMHAVLYVGCLCWETQRPTGVAITYLHVYISMSCVD